MIQVGRDLRRCLVEVGVRAEVLGRWMGDTCLSWRWDAERMWEWRKEKT